MAQSISVEHGDAAMKVTRHGSRSIHGPPAR
jgi:hypothetical protein